MGDHFSFCSKQQGRLTLVKMLRFVVLALMAAAALGAPGGGHYEYGYNQKHCHTKYNVKYDQQCHEEYDTIVDTTYTEECQDIVTQHCNSVSKQVHHSSAVVGHDTHVVAHGHGYGKREAEPAGYGSAPVCKEHVERQCHQVPQHLERKVPRQVCHSEPRQQCHQSAHKVPRRVCANYYDDKKNNKDNKKNRGYGYGSDDKKNNKDNKKNRGYGYGYGRY